MKMEKASERDIDAAGELMQILEAIDARFGGPWPTDGPESLEKAIGEENFDADKHEHLQGLYNSLAALLRRAPNFHGRVIGGMCYVILYDKNEIVDLEADTLELHPKLQKALEDSEKVAQLQQRIAELEAERDAADKAFRALQSQTASAGKDAEDARRLDFIEEQGNAFTWGIREHTEPVGSYVVNLGDSISVDGPTFRAAIDAAIAAIEKEKP